MSESVPASNETHPIDPFAWVGATLDGKYLLERVVGEGGFGVVYHATHITLREPVAIKCLKLGQSFTGPVRDRFLESFLNEGKLLMRLSSVTTGIVQARDAGAAVSPNGLWSPYLVLEWLEGKTLAEDLAERKARALGNRSLVEALDLLQPAVNALDVALKVARVAHRDLKPENLFLARVGNEVTVKVLDFGIAKVMSDAAPMTPAAAITGIAPRAFSIAYGAPEQFEPVLGATGPWTDVYALALVALEVVSGRPAYTGTSSGERRDEAVNPERRPSFDGHAVAVSDAVDSVMQRALAVDPRNRFRTAAEFWRELRNAAVDERPASIPRLRTEPASLPRARPRPARQDRELRPITSPVVHLQPPQQHVYSQRRHPSTLRWLYGLLVLPVLLLGATVGLHFLRARSAAITARTMALIPEGRYVIGSTAGDERRCEAPRRGVYLLPFFIDQREVTFGEYKKCQAAGKCSSTRQRALEQEKQWSGDLCNELRSERGEQVDDNPMNCVDRRQAIAYCTFVEKRLPTDDEWEAAARGRDGAEYPWGNVAPSCDKAIFGRPPGKACAGRGTERVGSLRANSFGVFDMAGNVWEWTATSCPKAVPYGSPTKSPDPDAIPDVTSTQPVPTDRQEAEIARLTRQLEEQQDKLGEGKGEPAAGTLRGGGWEWSADNLASWKRLPWRPSQGGVSTGFRCAKDAPE